MATAVNDRSKNGFDDLETVRSLLYFENERAKKREKARETHHLPSYATLPFGCYQALNLTVVKIRGLNRNGLIQYMMCQLHLRSIWRCVRLRIRCSIDNKIKGHPNFSTRRQLDHLTASSRPNFGLASWQIWTAHELSWVTD